MSSKQQNFLAVGDVILGPNPEVLFPLIEPTLKTADILFGQLEVTHTNKIEEAVKHGRTVENLEILSKMGFQSPIGLTAFAADVTPAIVVFLSGRKAAACARFERYRAHARIRLSVTPAGLRPGGRRVRRWRGAGAIRLRPSARRSRRPANRPR